MRQSGLYQWLLALLLLLFIVQCVRLVFTVLTPVDPAGRWSSGVAAIVPHDQRQRIMAAFDPFFRADVPIVDAGPAQITSLNIKLFGINRNQATGGGSAIIAGEDGVQNSLAVGDEIMPGIKLAELAQDHVFIETSGRREILYLDQSIMAEKVGTSPAAANPSAASSAVPGAAGKLTRDALASAVSLKPRQKDGKVTGIAASPGGDGKIFAKLGLRPGDIITQINGAPAATPADFTAQLHPGARLSLTVERGADAVPIAITLDE